MACFWIFSTQLVDQDEINWISNNDTFQNQTDLELYVTSFYFMVTTITTVGYGDISGTNIFERVVCIILMVMGVVFFSISSGNITSIISN